MKKLALALAMLVAAAGGGAAIWNYAALQRPLDAAIARDGRNAGLSARAHFGHFVDADVAVFDLRTVGAENSQADVFRLFLQFADATKDRNFGRVVLAYRGVARFQIDGSYFQELGRGYAEQNPVYTVRTFPEHLFRPDGSRAFQEWSGGWLGVVKAQMDDFSEFHRQWYLNDLAAAQR